MNWIEVSIKTDGEASEAVAEYLSPFSHNRGVVLEQLGNVEDPDPNSLVSTVNVKIYLPDEVGVQAQINKIEEVIFQLGRIYPIPKPTYQTLVEEDWANTWKKNFKPFHLGKRLWIQPSWIKNSHQHQDDITITIDPGMAFGTGLHPSTQLCLEAIEQLLIPGSRVLDVGSGSGILSIAAAKLGAESVTAFDTDYIAVRATLDNVIVNQLAVPVNVYQGELRSLTAVGWDLVIVNILAPVIISLFSKERLLDYITKRGRLILSGIIVDQQQDVEDTINKWGGIIERRLISGDWISLVTAKAPDH